ncbi:protoporphyrinogen oxidase [Amycolatopsis sp. FDAARGOS 1241]|uniref:protoporphyrinogen oxidase n=1 Tax=Amycolatopsis sp. FDAARGOS 1241 TaxID=2778070 RepID=UPI0019518AF4|nr:protoporphyrinogen oxidase [Amycolatopsis sp. FDAARGOS 1241]QRP43892.1 protoporphyrinogen oxidase [Amycolatopsis sp. FDAARGOS 1241]
MKHVAVVGGGISGLTTAYRLRTLLGDAVAITVFESTPATGGKLRTAEVGGVPYDVGAEAFLARRPEVTALVTEIGLAERLVHPTKARAKIHAGGAVLGLPPGTVMGVPGCAGVVAGVLSEDGRRAVEKERSLGPVELTEADLALGPLLRGRFGDELVDRLVDPLLGGVYAGGADGLGLRATMPGLAKAVAEGAGSLTDAAASLLPKTPGTAPVFGTLTGGLTTLLDRLRELSCASVRTSAAVRALTRTAAGWRLDIGAASPAHAPADTPVGVDAVVLAVPAPAARKLLDGVAPAASAAFAEVELASMAVVALALPPGTQLPDASGILIGAGERDDDGVPYASKAFTFSSNKWAHYGGEGPVLVRGSVGRFREPGALTGDDDSLVAAVRDDLARLTGVTAEPIDTLVTRWGGGLPQYGAGHLDRVTRIETAVARLPGLAVAGATLHGVGLPACVATADAAARRIAAALGV